MFLLSSAGAATDLVMRGARCALSIAAAHEGIAAAVVCGRQVLGPTAPAGELIERAVQLVGSEPGRAGIRIDEVTASLLGGRFDVDGGEGLERGADLAASSVDDDEVGHGFSFFLQAAVAAAHDFLHGAEVVVADETFDLETSVVIFVGPALREVNH